MSEPSHDLTHPSRPLADVPVYNCHVYLAAPDERGSIAARTATLAGITAVGRNEREALRNIVAKFKESIAGHVARGEPIPWVAEPYALAPGETQRFVPVHF
jgi:hypothetical protein